MANAPFESIDRRLAKSVPVFTGGTYAMIAFGAAVVVAFAPFLVSHFWAMWRSPQYQYFPFVICALAYLLYRRTRGVDVSEALRDAFRFPYLTIMTLSVCLLVVAAILGSPLAGVAACILMCGAFIWRLNQVCETNLWPVWALSLFLLKLPLKIDERVVQYLQLMSSRVSSQILDLIGIDHFMAGNVLSLGTRQLFVDEACSGIVSVMSIVAVGAIYSVWREYSLLRTCCLLLIGVGWAFVSNVFRILVITVADVWYAIDLSEGAGHAALGLIQFVVVFVAFLSSDVLLRFVLDPIADERQGEDSNLLIRVWNRLVSEREVGSRRQEVKVQSLGFKSLVALTAVLLVVAGWCSTGVFAFLSESSMSSVALADALDGQMLRPNTAMVSDVDTIERGADNPFGAFSKAFTCASNDNPTDVFQFSVDYPFFGRWHELTGCYLSSGWSMVEREVHNVPWPYVVVTLKNDVNEYGLLIFGLCSTEGEPAQVPGYSNMIDRVKIRLRTFGRGMTNDEMLQFQAWSVSRSPYSKEEIGLRIAQFDELRSLAATQIFNRVIGSDGMPGS